jgi:phosphoglycolate phosphatase
MTAVLFDLDGTLTNSAPGITACIQHAMRELGREAPAVDALGWCIGPPLTASFARLLATEDAALVAQALGFYRARFTSVGFAENAVYDGAPKAVRAVRALGHRTFVATSKPEPYARKIVEHFAMGGLFDGVHGSELSGARGEKTELIAHVMAAERLDPAGTIMIGDREHDVIGARACGIPCIGVAYGYGGEDELRRSGAIAIAADPGELAALVQRHIGSRPRPIPA